MAPEGRVLLSADYAQMELRVMAHLSGDEALCAALRDPSQDPFSLWASKWLRMPLAQVTCLAFMGAAACSAVAGSPLQGTRHT